MWWNDLKLKLEQHRLTIEPRWRHSAVTVNRRFMHLETSFGLLKGNDESHL